MPQLELAGFSTFKQCIESTEKMRKQTKNLQMRLHFLNKGAQIPTYVGMQNE